MSINISNRRIIMTQALAVAPSSTTVYSDPGLGGNNAIAVSCSLRVGVAVAFASGPLGQVRVTIQAGAGANASQGIVCDHLAIGVSTGTLPNTTATPIELTGFNGTPLSSGCSITTASGQQTSDWVPLSGLTWTNTDTLVIIFDEGSAVILDPAFNVGAATVGAFGASFSKNPGVSYNVAAPAGFGTSLGTFGYGVVSVETR